MLELRSPSPTSVDGKRTYARAALRGSWQAASTMSEFGRTVAENGSGGTDHGHANCMLALGGSVKGGRILGDWPSLERELLYEGRDLAVTTDFRDVFAEVVSGHLGAEHLDRIFPGYGGDPARYRGVLG